MAVVVREADIQRSIIEYLTIKQHFVWRQNSGMFTGEYKGKKRFIRAGIKGIADIIGVHARTGHMIAIEVKRTGEFPTAEQFEFISHVKKCGGTAFIAYSLEDVINQGL